MAIYTHHGLPGSPAEPWSQLVPTGTRDSGNPGEVIFLNSDGTETHVFGDLSSNGFGSYGGVAESVTRTGAGGGTIYETIVDIGHYVFLGVSFPYADSFTLVFQGDDSLTGWSGDDLLAGGAGGDVLNGGGGFDIADYRLANIFQFVIADLENSAGNTGEAGGDSYISIEGLIGSWNNDRLLGDGGHNRLHGERGDDTLAGRGGADHLDGGEGSDWVDYTDSATPVTIDLVAGAGSGGDAAGDSYISIENGIGTAGSDTFIGNDADNTFHGWSGADHFEGGEGRDTASYSGSDGSLTLDLLQPGSNTGHAAGDSYLSVEDLRGSEHNDWLFGDNSSAGNWLDGGGGGDRLDGRGGFDFASYWSARHPVTVNLADPTQNTTVDAVGDRYISIEGIVGSRFNDRLIGNTADNIFISSDEDADFIDGGAGFDIVSYRYFSNHGAPADLNRTAPTFANVDYFSSIEGVIGSNQGDFITGTPGMNLLRGEDGDDVINGGGGADIIIGGRGNERYIVDVAGATLQERPGEGIDAIHTSLSAFSLASYTHIENLYYIGSGNATLTGDLRSNIIESGDGDDVIDGGRGADTMYGGLLGDDTYYVDSIYDAVHDLNGTDTIYSSVSYHLPSLYGIEKLTLTGNAALSAFGAQWAEELTGNGAANFLDGGGGVDRLIGMGGDDTYVVDQLRDVIIEAENAGTDTVRTKTGTFSLAVNVENLLFVGASNFIGIGNEQGNRITGQAGADNLVGGAGDDALIGNGGDDRLNGEAGNDLLDGGSNADTMSGGAGDDTFKVDHAGDVVIEGASGGNDTVLASINYTLGAYVENLTLTGATNGIGNKFSNELAGSDFANALDGGFGADRLIGGGSNDTLTGGRDGDTFVFRPEFGHDVITDFTVSGIGHDILEFDAEVFADAGAFFSSSIDTNDGVLVTVDGGSSLLIHGTSIAQLNAHPDHLHFL